MRTALLMLALLTACDDELACEEAGALRCTEDGAAREVCTATADGNRWARQPCPASTPVCEEEGSWRARCVSEGLEACDESSFEGSCVDDTTVEHCDGRRRRLRCDDGQRCMRLPGHAVAESATGAFGCVSPRPTGEPPALVTYLSGEVLLGDGPPPSFPFRVPPDTALHLSDGAVVIVLVKERASRLTGPAEVDVYELQPDAIVPTAEAAEIVRRLSGEPPEQVPAEEVLLRPAPSGPGVIRWLIGEGVPGAGSSIGEISWQCETACGRTVEVADREQVLFRTQGERSVRYDGPQLDPSHTYALRVGDLEYRLETQSPPAMSELLASMDGWSLEEQMSVVAAVHLYGGSRAAAVEALYRARRGDATRYPEMVRLRSAYGIR